MAVSRLMMGISTTDFNLVFPKGILNVNIEPSSILLFRFILPPCASINCFTIAKPKPVPPYEFAVPVSACSKTLKIVSILSAAMPIPVSVTANSMITFSLSSLNNLRLMPIFPLWVNLIALLIRFKII